MKTRLFVIVLLAVVALGAIFGYKIHKNRQAQAALAQRKPAPAVITTIQSVSETWQSTLHAVGTLESFQGVTIRSEIEGRVTKIGFDSGQIVKAGTLLVELDVANEVAQLASQEASAKLAQLNLERARELHAKNINTASDLDNAEASSAQAIAGIENIKATLAKKRIVAPFDGRLGIRQVNLGQFLNKGDLVVPLESLSKMYVDFSLPQQDISQLAVGIPVHVTVDAYPGRIFEGTIEAIDPRISATTRTVRIRATLDNDDEALRPNMFARVEVQLPRSDAIIALPATSVVYSPYGDSVYVVANDPEKNAAVAQQRFVTVGPKRGDQVSILKGLNAGEEVVTSGQGKLRPGALVQVNNSVLPANQANPKPTES
jgi:membrane fusion protein (multidrug efflux system)